MKVRRFSRRAMGTVFEILIPGGNDRYSASAAGEAFDELGRIEQELSRFVPTSDVSRINGLRRGETMKLGPDGFACLKAAAETGVLTAGAFDVTAGAGRRRGGVARLELDLRTRMVRAGCDEVGLDLGGIGKGYALDRMADVLTEWEVKPALLHGGQSTAFASGAPPGKSSWRVPLRHPGRRGSRAAGVALLSEGAISGSALLVRGRHVFDPRSGRPVSGGRASWAAASSAARADALSTAFLVMPAREVSRLCLRFPGISGVLAGRQRGGRWKFRAFGSASGVALKLPLMHHRRNG